MLDALLGPEEEAVTSMELRFQQGMEETRPTWYSEDNSCLQQRVGMHRVGGVGGWLDSYLIPSLAWSGYLITLSFKILLCKMTIKTTPTS